MLENSEINFANKAKLLIAEVSKGSDQKHCVEPNSIWQSNYSVFLSGCYNTGTVVFLLHEVSMIDVFLTSWLVKCSPLLSPRTHTDTCFVNNKHKFGVFYLYGTITIFQFYSAIAKEPLQNRLKDWLFPIYLEIIM